MEQINLETMKQTDIRTIDKKFLVDIGDIKIDKKKSKEERLWQFVQDVKNPYCFICEGMIVKSSFSEEGEELESKMARLISRMGE